MDYATSERLNQNRMKTSVAHQDAVAKYFRFLQILQVLHPGHQVIPTHVVHSMEDGERIRIVLIQNPDDLREEPSGLRTSGLESGTAHLIVADAHSPSQNHAVKGVVLHRKSLEIVDFRISPVLNEAVLFDLKFRTHHGFFSDIPLR